MASRSRAGAVAATLLGASLGQVSQADDTADLAQQLSNPVAALISVPLQLNYNHHVGPVDDGHRWTLNIQPVIPIELNEDWNLISRTILPIVSQQDIFPGTGSQSGAGDIVQSLFFSPKAPTAGGWIWGAGPALLLPPAPTNCLRPTSGVPARRSWCSSSRGP